MAAISKVQLTLTNSGANVTFAVTYEARFGVLERRLVGLGLAYAERIQVQGVDPGAAVALATFPEQPLPVTDGTTPQVISRSRSLIVARAALEEDPDFGEADEVRCRIDVVPVGMPAVAGAFSATHTLTEPPVTPIPAPARTLKFAVDSIRLPQQRTDFALDLNGDAKVDNQFGNLVAALVAQNLDLQASVDAGVLSSALLITLKCEKADLSVDQRIDIAVGFGSVVDPEQRTFQLDPSRPPVTFFGQQRAGLTTSLAPVVGTVPAVLPVTLHVFGAPVTFPLRPPHVRFRLLPDGPHLVQGQLSGALTVKDLNDNFGLTLAKAIAAVVDADPNTFMAHQFLQIFDQGGCTNPDGTQAQKGDGKIDVCEVLSNSIIKNVLLPDVELFDDAGRFVPQSANTNRDSYSVGIGFTAMSASF